MKEIRTEDAVGHVLCHDITQIIKDEKKGVLFKKGHIVREEDIPALLSVGKEHLYVWEKQEGILHENEAAEILYRISADIHMHGSDIKEGKIELIADCDGVLKIRRDALLAVNSLGEMMIASRHGDFPVKKGDKIAGTRIIPLVIEKSKMDKAEKVAGTKPIFSILLHIDEGNADEGFDQSHKSVRSVARHNDAVTIVFFKALGTVVHGKRRVVTAFEQALRAIWNLRILFDHELEVFLISLGGRRLDDLVVEVNRRGRPQTADHAHFKGLGQRRDISREQRLRIIGGRQTLTRIASRIHQTHRKFRLQFRKETMRTTAGKTDHVGAGFLQTFHRIEVIDFAGGFFERVRRISCRLHKVAFVKQHSHGGILGKNRRLDFKSSVAVMSDH